MNRLYKQQQAIISEKSQATSFTTWMNKLKLHVNHTIGRAIHIFLKEGPPALQKNDSIMIVEVPWEKYALQIWYV